MKTDFNDFYFNDLLGETSMKQTVPHVPTSAITEATAAVRTKLQRMNAALSVLDKAEQALLAHPSKETIGALLPALQAIQSPAERDFGALLSDVWSTALGTLQSIRFQEEEIADQLRRQAIADQAQADRDAADIAEATRIQRLLSKLPAAV